MISTQFRPTMTDAGIALARELLHAAHATAGQFGARDLRGNCTTALRQLGGTPRRHPYSRRVTAGLTSREMDVMQLVAQGNTSRQIGHTLFISPRTVERHVRSSMQKLRCKTRIEAVCRLTELGALPQPGTARQELSWDCVVNGANDITVTTTSIPPKASPAWPKQQRHLRPTYRGQSGSI